MWKKGLLLLIFVVHLHAYSSELYYMVKKGDNLGAIVYSLYLKPLWSGESRFLLKKTVAINKNKGPFNRRILTEGQKVWLPSDQLPDPCNSIIENTGEVKIKNLISHKSNKNILLDKCQIKTSIDPKTEKHRPNIVESKFKKSKDRTKKSIISLSAYQATMGLKVKDNRTTAKGGGYTYQIIGLHGQWEQYWTRLFKTKIFGDIRRIRVPNSHTVKFVEENFYVKEGGVGAFFDIRENLDLGLSAVWIQKIFLMGFASQVYAFDRITIGQLNLSSNYRFFDYDIWEMTANLSVAYSNANKTSRYKVRDGLDFGLGLKISVDVEEEKKIFFSSRYKQKYQNTDFSKQRTYDLVLGLGVSVEF